MTTTREHLQNLSLFVGSWVSLLGFLPITFAYYVSRVRRAKCHAVNQTILEYLWTFVGTYLRVYRGHENVWATEAAGILGWISSNLGSVRLGSVQLELVFRLTS